MIFDDKSGQIRCGECNHGPYSPLSDICDGCMSDPHTGWSGFHDHRVGMDFNSQEEQQAYYAKLNHDNMHGADASNRTTQAKQHKELRIGLTDLPCNLFRPLKLSPELVPVTAWFANVRAICEQSTWDIIRKRTYRAYNYRCGICNGTGSKHPVECHEVWAYDDIDHIMALPSLIALCPRCHSVKHMGFAQTRGAQALSDAINHMAAVNEISVEDCIQYIRYYDDIMCMRSQYEWLINKASLTRAAPELLNDSKFQLLARRS